MKLQLTTLPTLLLLIALIATDHNEDDTNNRIDAGIAQCHATTQVFAQLAKDPDFGLIHEDPQAFDYFQASGEMITYDVPGGEPANAYMVASQESSDDYLFVIHEWYGLNDYVKNESEKFAVRYPKMNVIALDLYDGKVANNSEDARKYMQTVTTERALAIINATQDFAGETANIFTVGWCFGGGWSLQAAIALGNQAKGAVMFYGMPETDPTRLSQLECDVLGIFANNDGWITPQVARDFEEAMSQLDNELILKAYDADHGFANPSNPKYNEAAASDAFDHMFDFISARR